MPAMKVFNTPVSTNTLNFYKILSALLLCEVGGYFTSIFFMGHAEVQIESFKILQINLPLFLLTFLWTTFYLIMAVPFWVAWKNSNTRAKKIEIEWIFITQFILSFLMTFFLFSIDSMLLAVFDIILLLVFIILKFIHYNTNLSKVI
jgi:tryptophan-rich sensory protein